MTRMRARYLLAETDPERCAAVLSLPALGGIGMQARARHAVRALVSGLAATARDAESEPLPRFTSRWRLLVGMVLWNRPWLLVPGLEVRAGGSADNGGDRHHLTPRFGYWLAPCHRGASIVATYCLHCPGCCLAHHRRRTVGPSRRQFCRGPGERSRLYNTSTLVTLAIGVIICYLALYVVNLGLGSCLSSTRP